LLYPLKQTGIKPMTEYELAMLQIEREKLAALQAIVKSLKSIEGEVNIIAEKL
jgi:hypothetical protein